MRYLHYSLLIVLVLSGSLTFEGVNSTLINCKSSDYSFKSNLLVLHTKNTTKSEIYLIYNKKKQRLLLSHPDYRRITNAGWDSMLQTGNWSALMVSHPNFTIRCKPLQKNFQTKPAVSCARVLTVCVYPHLKNNDSAMKGTFWLAEDQSLETLLDTIKKRLSS